MAPDAPDAPVTVADFLRLAQATGLDRLDGQLIACAVLARPRSWLLAHDTDPLPAEHLPRLLDWLKRRADGEPLAYLVGDKEFFGLPLRVSPDVLVPRPDTETLVHWALETLDRLARPARPAQRSPAAHLTVADLGTGSGAIALAIASARPDADVTAVDFSPGALAVARDNARRLGLNRIRFAQGSWFEPLNGQRFQLVVSNPPYIAEGDAHLPALRHEPISALTSGPDGLDDLRLIVREAPVHLHENGWLLLEHGHDQAQAVQGLLTQAGFVDVSTRFDLGPQPRCTGGRWAGTGSG